MKTAPSKLKKSPIALQLSCAMESPARISVAGTLSRSRRHKDVSSLPTQAHNRTAADIVQSILQQVAATGNDFGLFGSLCAEGDTTHNVGDRDQEPDQLLIPRAAPPGVFPNLVVEIAHTHESW
uniref:Uma2 family endonuclease n=1 Tax=Globisporangium ultimum (strain ATCC 200006 / CBS 805.95 / DAOM BR144) TaxID=431595 RepID=K3WEP3_GLOUD